MNTTTPPVPADTRLDLAVAALAASRLRLRNEMLPTRHDTPGTAGGTGSSPWQHPWRLLRQWLGASAPAALLLDGVARWWQRHPWRPAGETVVAELRASALPLIRRHPWATLGAAAAAGALLVAGRGRVWPVVVVQVRPLPSRLLHWLLAELRSAPAQAALASLLLVALRGRTGDGPADEPPPTPAAPGTAAAPPPRDDPVVTPR